uniref:Uncharacterized protein n=1 Tax=Vespula pensylvanica TaxID=30213 RepID=A0A834UA35_VESPE|nr:hypothetical protein H0235_007758 [Vespula pensylvanica]
MRKEEPGLVCWWFCRDDAESRMWRDKIRIIVVAEKRTREPHRGSARFGRLEWFKLFNIMADAANEVCSDLETQQFGRLFSNVNRLAVIMKLHVRVISLAYGVTSAFPPLEDVEMAGNSIDIQRLARFVWIEESRLREESQGIVSKDSQNVLLKDSEFEFNSRPA